MQLTRERECDQFVFTSARSQMKKLQFFLSLFGKSCFKAEALHTGFRKLFQNRDYLDDLLDV